MTREYRIVEEGATASTRDAIAADDAHCRGAVVHYRDHARHDETPGPWRVYATAAPERLNTTTLSSALRQAIGDLDWGLERDIYVPAGDVWHRPRGANAKRCAVCLGGAVFRRFGVPPEERTDHTTLYTADRITTAELHMISALDDLRLGDIKSAAHVIDASPEKARAAQRAFDTTQSVGTVRLETTRDLSDWKESDRTHYVELADLLEAHGL